jgi:DNA-binding response OmpR family regulator
MRGHIVLAIHNDPRIVRRLKETFASLGDRHDWARSQEDARRLLGANDCTDILLDLEIPACSKGGIPSIDNGLSLLEELRADERLGHVPIIVTVRRSGAKPGLVVRVMQCGATDFIEKPFPTEGRTLRVVIKEARLRQAPAGQAAPAPKPAPSSEPAPFKGGEMVFYSDRVELCGVKIVGDTGFGYARAILVQLAQMPYGRRCVHMSSDALARKIGADGGSASVIGSIRTIRESIKARLLERLNLVCGRDDVIANDGFHGYCLNKWITVRYATDNATGPVSNAAQPGQRNGREPVTEPVREPIREPVSARVEPADEPVSEPLTQRQERILRVLGSGDSMRVPAIANRTRASPATVKRELALLKGRGMVAFEGPPRSGRYRITASKQR